MTSSYMMQNIVEEKETRMVEMLTTSITPLPLLWGKLIGLSALGLLPILSWSVAGGNGRSRLAGWSEPGPACFE